MIRIGLSAILWVLLATAASAQVVYNPDSPRGRRDLVANPPPPKVSTPQFEATEPQRWGTLGAQVGQSTWGTIGTYGWSYPGYPPPWQTGQ